MENKSLCLSLGICVLLAALILPVLPSFAIELRGDPSQLFSASGLTEDFGFKDQKVFKGKVEDSLWILSMTPSTSGDTFTAELLRQSDRRNPGRRVCLTGYYESFYRDRWHLDSNQGVFVDGFTEPHAENGLRIHGIITEGGRMYNFSMYPASSTDLEELRKETEKRPSVSPVEKFFNLIDSLFGSLKEPFQEPPAKKEAQNQKE